MGQSWSSSGEQIEGILPLDEITVPPPDGLSCRASLRLNANTKYPGAADEPTKMIRNFLKKSPDIKEMKQLGLRALKDPHSYAGLALLTEYEEQEGIVAAQVDLAKRRILPGLRNRHLVSWLKERILEPVGDGGPERMLSEGTLFSIVEGLPGRCKTGLYHIRVFVVRQWLQEVHKYNVLVGIAVSIDEIVPLSKGDLYPQHSILGIDEIECTRTFEACGKKVKIIQEWCPSRPFAKVGPRTPPQVPVISPKKRTRINRDGIMSPEASPKDDSNSSPTKRRTRTGAIPWTDEEKELCVHFYWTHYCANKKTMDWSNAAELWRTMTSRGDTAIQLESSRRRFESMNIDGNGAECPLCKEDKKDSETSESNRKVSKHGNVQCDGEGILHKNKEEVNDMDEHEVLNSY